MKQRNWSQLKIDGVIIVSQVAVCAALLIDLQFGYARSVAENLLFWLVYLFLEARYHWQMSSFVRGVVGFTLFCDSFFGYYLHFYVHSFVFDKMLHVLGSYSLALFFYLLTVQKLPNRLPKFVTFLFVAALGLAIGAAYEILEFLGDNLMQPMLFSQLSLLDTDLDLTADLTGALLAGNHAAFKKLLNEKF